MKEIKSTALLAAVLTLASAAHAQSDHDSWIKVGASFFGNDDKSVYGSLAVGQSVSKDLRLQLGATPTLGGYPGLEASFEVRF